MFVSCNDCPLRVCLIVCVIGFEGCLHVLEVSVGPCIETPHPIRSELRDSDGRQDADDRDDDQELDEGEAFSVS